MSRGFGAAGASYPGARPPYHAALYPRLCALGIGNAGETLVDLGAGSGLLSAPLLKLCRVLQVDPDEALLRRSTAAERIVATGEMLPLPDRSTDCVVAGNCWHWFDRARAASEIARVLKPSGRVGVVYQTYVPHPGGVAADSEALLAEHLPNWRHANSTGVNGQVLRDLQAAGFVRIESFSFDVSLSFSADDWHAYLMTHSVLVDAPPPRRQAFAEAHSQLLRSRPAEVAVLHRLFTVVAQTPASSYTEV